MRWTKIVGGLVALILLMTGCIKFETDIKVEDDGSGVVRMLTALNTEALGEEILAFLPADQMCDEFASDLDDPAAFPPDAVIEDYDEGSFCGAKVTFDLEPSNDHSETIGDAISDTGATRLFKDDASGNWIFETELDTSDITNDDDFISDVEFEEMMSQAEVRFVIDLPGRAIDGQNNATNVGSDGRFEWDIDLLDPPDRLFAQTEPGSGGGSGGGLGKILIIAAALLLVSLAAWWFLTRRNKGGGTTSPIAPPAGAATAMAPPANPATSMTPPANPATSMTPPAGAVIPPTAEQPLTQPPYHSARETVAMSAADLEAARTEAAAATSDSQASPSPEWDPVLNAWVHIDPIRGKLVHDSATDTWKPA